MTFLMTALLLLTQASVVVASSAGCRLSSQALQDYSKEGDVMFGALVPVHAEIIFPTMSFTESPTDRYCDKIYVEMYQCALAMVFATDEINQNPKLLPNVTLGFRILDTCDSDCLPAQGSLWLLSGVKDTVPNYSCQHPLKMVAVLGDTRSSSSVQVARILGLRRIPQISYGSGLPFLSDKRQFPSFVRTNPSTDSVPYILAQLVIQFGWTWVGILASDSDYGLHGSQKLRRELANNGVCVAFLVTVSDNDSDRKISSIVDLLKKSTVTGVILYTYPTEVNSILDTLAAQGVMGKVWLISTSLVGSFLFYKENLWKLLNGTLGIPPHKRESRAFQKFLYKLHPSLYPNDIYIKAFWEYVFECQWLSNKSHQNTTDDENRSKGTNICTGSEKLEALPTSMYDVNNFRFSYYAYTAVHVLANALDAMLSCSLRNKKCPDMQEFRPWQVPRSVCSESCSPGYRKVPRQGQPYCCFDCIQCTEGQISTQRGPTPRASGPPCATEDTSTPGQDQAFSEDTTPANLDDERIPGISGLSGQRALC
ncbi:vomeronasal type-2 receptor 1-like [Pleurodeles waltl]|uniref:vomeronasal type-2 receptor 1-like n=1 Tax=Pleurodeles waltl TaxID=8319 RepID=UPI00370944A7